MRLIHAENLEDIALGAAVLGTGGGGDPYIGKLMGIDAIHKFGPVQLVCQGAGLNPDRLPITNTSQHRRVQSYLRPGVQRRRKRQNDL